MKLNPLKFYLKYPLIHPINQDILMGFNGIVIIGFVGCKTPLKLPITFPLIYHITIFVLI